jgi:Na+/H+ antiporter NhaD/arsenite permease-like protein
LAEHLQHFQVILATAIFLLTYAVIISEKIHRAVAAMIGAALLALTQVLSVQQAVQVIDFNTIGLLTGMMIIVGVTRQTGFFEYMAIKAARLGKGEPFRIIGSLALVTTVTSAFLDNVTTVLLIVPVTFAIAKQLEISPIPFLVAEIISSNIGGTATLIGDPPNIMIGSRTGLGFMDFFLNLTPIIIVIFILTILAIRVIYRRQLFTSPRLQESILQLNEKDEIKDYLLLRKCLIVIALTVAGFVLHQYLHLESSVIALSGASLLLLITRDDPSQAFQAVEWPVIFFFGGLFVVVGALDKVGVIERVAKLSLDVTNGALVPTATLILWLSAVASAFVDNIPFVATMIPLIQDMGRLGHISNLNLLWWSLSLGACLGGNGTIIGASANVVVIGMAEKRGVLISFISYLKVAFPLMVMSIIISHLYLLFWYHYHGAVSFAGTLLVAIILGLTSRLLNGRLVKREQLKVKIKPDI